MAHFAEVKNGVVLRVIVAEQDFIDSGLVGDPKNWIQTSYNTVGGVHYGANGQPDGGVPLRKNFAGVGDTYDKVKDAFIPSKPTVFNSWILNQVTCRWEPPIPYPKDGKVHIWDEANLKWK